MTTRQVSFTVNGEAVSLLVDPRRHLGDVLRENLGLPRPENRFFAATAKAAE